jgi:hypothetical protein
MKTEGLTKSKDIKGLPDEELIFTNPNVTSRSEGNLFIVSGTEEELKRIAIDIFNHIENNGHPESYEKLVKELIDSEDEGLRPPGFAICFAKEKGKRVLWIQSRSSFNQPDRLRYLKNIVEEATKVFKFPNLEIERGEIERVASTFSPNNKEDFVKRFFTEVKNTKLIPLTEDIWSTLENSDSYGISKNGWDEVQHHAVEGHTNNPRDWQVIKESILKATQINAPIILKFGTQFHLVAGNTRLMVSRAMGIIPDVLLVEMK